MADEKQQEGAELSIQQQMDALKAEIGKLKDDEFDMSITITVKGKAPKGAGVMRWLGTPSCGGSCDTCWTCGGSCPSWC